MEKGDEEVGKRRLSDRRKKERKKEYVAHSRRSAIANTSAREADENQFVAESRTLEKMSLLERFVSEDKGKNL